MFRRIPIKHWSTARVLVITASSQYCLVNKIRQGKEIRNKKRQKDYDCLGKLV